MMSEASKPAAKEDGCEDPLEKLAAWTKKKVDVS
jgi:hypothetical protein